MPLSEILVAVTALIGALAVFLLVRALFPDDLLEEVAARRAEASEPAAGAPPAGPRPSFPRALGGALVRRVGDLSAALASASFEARMRRRFVAMGQPDYRACDFIAQQLIWAVFFGLLGLLALDLLSRPLLYALVFALFGALFPHIWLRDQIAKRQRAIARALPYHIDLLTLAVEAGLDFQAALGTVIQRGQGGPLIDELNLMQREVRLGKTRAEALRNLADRVQISEMTAFVSNLIQAEKMGTSLGKVLRIQSAQMRINRAQRAEKLANEAPVKMLFPLIACIFPTVFMILFGPIVFRLLYGG